MRIRRLLVAGLLSLCLAPVSFAADRNAPISDAAAGCTYGTASADTVKLPAPGSISSLEEFNRLPRDPCTALMMWTANNGGNTAASVMTALTGPNTDPNYSEVQCTTVADPACDPKQFPKGVLFAYPVFYHCATDTDINCIRSVTVIAPDGTEQVATYARDFPSTATLPAGDTFGAKTPAGGNPSVWKYTTAEGERSVLLAGSVSRQWQSNGTQWTNMAGMFRFEVVPVNVVASDARTKRGGYVSATRNVVSGAPVTRIEWRDQASGDPACAKTMIVGAARMYDDGACLTAASFPEGYRYRINLDLPDDLAMFLYGRINAPVAYTTAIAGGHRFTLEGGPEKLYNVVGSVPKSVMSQQVVDFFKNTYYGNQFFQEPADFPGFGVREPDFLGLVLPYVGDRATWVDQSWSLASTPQVGQYSQTCLNGGKGQMLGIISTNASAYDGNPPKIDKDTGLITWKVAGPHYDVDGKTLTVGHYYMNMNAQFMQCLLGVKKAPAVAQIGIEYNNGEQTVSTVTVKTDKDWLRLAADNFHYSVPTLKIAFAKDEAPAATPAAVKKSATITCVKGKTTKKVAGTKCPAGWKKR